MCSHLHSVTVQPDPILTRKFETAIFTELIYLSLITELDGSISFAKERLVMEYSCPKYIRSSLSTLLVMTSTVAIMSDAVPSKNRPHPPWKSVSPTNTAFGPVLDFTIKQPCPKEKTGYHRFTFAELFYLPIV